MQRRGAAVTLICAVAILVGVVTPGTRRTAQAQSAQPPSVVVILTDDQRVDELWMMDAVRRRLQRQGLTFSRAFVSDPLCCPSRASFLTGLYAHSTGVWSNLEGQDGGWQTFFDNGLEGRTLAVPLQQAGYRTAYVGKYLNGYGRANGQVPEGWDRWFVFDEANGKYFDYDIISVDGSGEPEHLSFGSGNRDYSTDVLRRRAVSVIERTPADVPLFMLVSPYAPHGPSRPAPRDLGTFSDVPVDRSPSYAERRIRDKPRYLRDIELPLPKAFDAESVQRRWESLLAVDKMVERVIRSLRSTDRLQNTMVVFMSDNGFLLGEHRWGFKVVPYEESIRVPLIIRFDPLTSGSTTKAIAANIDIAPTIAELAGVPFNADGSSLMPLLTGGGNVRTSILLEARQYTPKRLTTMPSYCGIRTRRWTFVRYATGEEELYDLRSDPYQLSNLANQGSRTRKQLRERTMDQCVPTPPLFSWNP